jgi:glucoamylase
MLPEQVWDGPDIPKLELYSGRATGGAMPLVWAHAEYAKLVRSLYDGRVFDMPQQPYERYVRHKRAWSAALWAPHSRVRLLNDGCKLRIQTPGPANVTWSVDGASTQREVASRDTTLGVWIADLDTAKLPVGTVLRFAVDGEDSNSMTVVARPATTVSRHRTRAG